MLSFKYRQTIRMNANITWAGCREGEREKERDRETETDRDRDRDRQRDRERVTGNKTFEKYSLNCCFSTIKGNVFIPITVWWHGKGSPQTPQSYTKLGLVAVVGVASLKQTAVGKQLLLLRKVYTRLVVETHFLQIPTTVRPC